MYLDENAFKSKHETKVVKEGKSITKCCYEVENGFIVSIEERTIPKEGEKDFKYVEPVVTVYISKTNPFENVKKKEEAIEDLNEMFKDTY